jgi:putative ABC transport system substrate-binding protein
MVYGLWHSDQFGRIAAIVAKILRGTPPAEIPFELPDRTTFVLNRATAKAIGVEIPVDMLLRATEIID